MRMLVSFVIGIITAVVVVALGALVALNGQSTSLAVPGSSVQVTMGWLLAAAAALGVVLAFLILIPGRLASAWQRWLLGQRAQALEQRLQALREEHAELQGSHRRLVEEHQRVLEHVLAPVAAARRGAEGETGAAAQQASREPTAQPALPRTGPLYPDGRRPRAAAVERQAPEREQAALLARLRDQLAALRARIAAMVAQLRRRTRASDDGDKGQTPNGTAASA